MYTIRPFKPCDAEYEAIVAVHNAVWPDDPNTVENWRHHHETRNREYLAQDFVVEGNGRLVAFGDCWESAWRHVPGKYGIDFNVHPAHADRGIDTLLYQHVLDFLQQRDPAPHTLMAHTREDKEEKVQFLLTQGFAQVMRFPVSELDVTEYDFARFSGLPERVQRAGIEILPLPELQARDANWMQKLYALSNHIVQDMPSPDPFTPQPLEEYAKTFAHPAHRPDAWFIALDGDQFVGLSTLWQNKAVPDKLFVGLTGVLGSHRRGGIATALKLRTIEFTQRQGARFIQTDNEENNPMYDLNMKLGFRPKPAWVDFEKKI